MMMTWAEFKEAVEAQGVVDEDLIAFIDCSCLAGHIEVQKTARDDAWMIM